MARLNEAQIQSGTQNLTNFLRNISGNEKLFIHHIHKGRDTRFYVAEKSGAGGINALTNPMLYNEMNCYFLGVLAAKENKVAF